MSITITDPALLAQLREAESFVELKDPDGNVLGTFTVEEVDPRLANLTSPFSREEMDERRKKYRDGRTLKDILRDLAASAI